MLEQVLWAYLNSPRESTGNTPHKLVYGINVVQPVEINLDSIRIAKENDLPIEDYQNLMFEYLNDLQEVIATLKHLVRQKEKIAKFYNSRVKYKSFQVCNLGQKVILPQTKGVENLENGRQM